jgi:hypothetical protein
MLMDLTTIRYDSFVSEMNLIKYAIDSSRTSLMANLGHRTPKKGVCCLESSKKIQIFFKYFEIWPKVALENNI